MLHFIRNESGQDIVEYSLMLVLVAAVAVLAMTAFGVPIRTLINSAASKLSAAAEAEPFSQGE